MLCIKVSLAQLTDQQTQFTLIKYLRIDILIHQSNAKLFAASTTIGSLPITGL